MLFSAQATLAECVILVHGLARTSASFLFMQHAFRDKGYDVVNTDYPSTKDTIEDLSAAVVPAAIRTCQTKGAHRIHFVTHSMGGIIVRHYLKTKKHRPHNLGHVVMLAPPNKGSEIVDNLGDRPAFELWNGIAGKQLGTEAQSLPNILGPVDYSVGIIAGNRSISPLFSKMIPGPDDGKVSVESTKIKGMTDHIVLPANHTFIMNSPSVFKQVVYFLENGQFNHEQ